ITFGVPLSDAQLNATADVPGTFVYVPPMGTILNAGANTLTAQFIPQDVLNYDAVTSSVDVNVSKESPVISWNPAAVTFGAALGDAQLNATANVPGMFIYTPEAGTVLTAGSHTLSVQFVPADSVNYETTTSSIEINVGKQTPVIQWQPKGLTFGTALGADQ